MIKKILFSSTHEGYITLIFVNFVSFYLVLIYSIRIGSFIIHPPRGPKGWGVEIGPRQNTVESLSDWLCIYGRKFFGASKCLGVNNCMGQHVWGVKVFGGPMFWGSTFWGIHFLRVKIFGGLKSWGVKNFKQQFFWKSARLIKPLNIQNCVFHLGTETNF